MPEMMIGVGGSVHASNPLNLSPRSSNSSHSSETDASPSPNGAEDMSPLQRLQFALERNSLFSNLITGGGEGSNFLNSSSEEEIKLKMGQDENKIRTPIGSPTSSSYSSSDPANLFNCPLCSVICNGRHAFNEHLVTHSQHHACPKCDYLTSSDENLREHAKEMHSIELAEPMEEDDESLPKVNSQGKVKTFKCKQCEHVSVTKSEFWAHSKSHIRSEKMLNCPKCSFVTEYKHHLEYHLRNHFGSKPFQCTSCSYSCVNKSMLNSHLKSHSAVYQYRCQDCSYATKYCHSLKLHLRKYNHSPSMVLNPDGTPNPLPIIDVYGTRRGPKMKKNGEPEKKKKNNRSTSSSTKIIETEDSNSTTPSSSPPQFSPREKNKNCPTPTNNMLHGLLQIGQNLAAPRPKIDPIPNVKNHAEMGSKNPLELYAAALNQYLFTNPLLHLAAGQNLDLAQIAQEQQEKILSQFLLNQRSPNMGRDFSENLSKNYENEAKTPLDLRKNEAENEIEKKRKRKGRALRYERIEEYSTNNNSSFETTKTCKYCSISFPDSLLYKNHMGFHSGDRDPFLCSGCGKRCKDMHSFYLHLNTDPH